MGMHCYLKKDNNRQGRCTSHLGEVGNQTRYKCQCGQWFCSPALLDNSNPYPGCRTKHVLDVAEGVPSERAPRRKKTRVPNPLSMPEDV